MSESSLAGSPVFFKGWAKPGPRIDGGRLEASPAEGETLDALSGDYRIYQLKDGHRFSTDDLLVAWYGSSWGPCSRRVLDLGSGLGSVGMMAAWRLPGAEFVTVEAQAISVALAQKSARYNQLESRYRIRHGDFRDPGVLGADERFDLIFGSPPYFPAGTGVQSEHPQRLACRFEMRGNIFDYCRVASEHLDWGGVFACIFPIQPVEQLARVEAAAREAGMFIIRKRPVILGEGDDPLLCLFLMGRVHHFPEWFRQGPWTEPALTIRRKDGKPHPEYSAVKISIGFPP